MPVLQVPWHKQKYYQKYLIVFSFVLEEGLEPSSLAACDFESHVYTIPPLQHYEVLKREGL